MKKISRCFVGICCLSLCFTFTTWAQLPKLPGLGKNDRKAAEPKPGPAQPTPTPPNRGGLNPDASSLAAKPPLEYKQFPPTFMYESLLKGLTVHANGNFLLNKFLTGVFLPTTEQGGQPAYFSDNPKHHLMLCAVKSASGGTVHSFHFSSYPDSKATAFQTADPKVSACKLPGPGAYVLEFSLDGKVFYKFPFEVKKQGSSDPYNPADTLFPDGPWRDYGYISGQGDDQNMRWNMWLPPMFLVGGQRNLKAKVEVLKGGKMVATNVTTTNPEGEPTAYHPNFWTPKEFVVTKPDRTAFRLTDLTAGDGKGEVLVTIDGKKTSYPFSVKGGKIEFSGRQIRETADALRLIEGGGSQWWIRRSDAMFD